jgi:hypothetical protein
VLKLDFAPHVDDDGKISSVKVILHEHSSKEPSRSSQCQNINDNLKLSNESSNEVVSLSRTPSPISIAVRYAVISLPYLVSSVATINA